jgi:hypothetical protein
VLCFSKFAELLVGKIIKFLMPNPSGLLVISTELKGTENVCMATTLSFTSHHQGGRGGKPL